MAREILRAWGGIVSAFKAGITPDMHLEAVNDQKFSTPTCNDAILSAEKSKEPIKLLLKREDEFVT